MNLLRQIRKLIAILRGGSTPVEFNLQIKGKFYAPYVKLDGEAFLKSLRTAAKKSIGSLIPDW